MTCGGEQWKKKENNSDETSWSQARTLAQNRTKWHHRIKAVCASERQEGRWGW